MVAYLQNLLLAKCSVNRDKNRFSVVLDDWKFLRTTQISKNHHRVVQKDDWPKCLCITTANRQKKKVPFFVYIYTIQNSDCYGAF